MALWEMIRTRSQNVLTRRASMTTSLASSSPSITLRSIRSSDLLRLSTSNSFFCNANWRPESIQNYSWKKVMWVLKANMVAPEYPSQILGRGSQLFAEAHWPASLAYTNFRPMREHIFTRKGLYCLTMNDTQGCFRVSTGMCTYMFTHTLNAHTYIQKRARRIKWPT